MRRALFLIIVGLGGTAILVCLGVWQTQRLAWKQDVIAQIEARIGAEPGPLPKTPEPTNDAYPPVKVTGTIGPNVLRVLVSEKQAGAGYRLISPFLVLDHGWIMVDRGFLPAASDNYGFLNGPVTVTGNLQWPDEVDSFTPEPDLEKNIWFARDVDAMAAHLGMQPVLLVAREVSFDDGDVTPMPVDTARIPNNHLQYAITWFSLAAIWLAMSLYFFRRRADAPES